MVKCHICGKEVAEDKAIKVTIGGKTYYFDNEGHLNQFQPVKSISRRLSSVVLSKTSAELVAIGTGLAGVFYTISALPAPALLMDTFSAMAAIAALVIGIEHLRYLREHNLMRRAVLLFGIGILIIVALVVWNFGFRFEQL
jgi:YHS domain-containing protein